MKPVRAPFLESLGLPAAWGAKPQWRILDTDLGDGKRFLETWRTWKADPRRPRLLHYVALQAEPLSADQWRRREASESETDYELAPLTNQLRAQCFGLLPGFHRLAFEDGRVLLTICVGELKSMLREQQFEADAVYLTDVRPRDGTARLWDLWTCKALARCCRRGTVLIASNCATPAMHRALIQAGFVSNDTASPSPVSREPRSGNWQGIFNPAWVPKRRRLADAPVDRPHPSAYPSRCVVIGAGLSGASVAASLARRGWQVEVLDAASAPASGASGLPAGLLAPHSSPDDSVLSRLSRCGVRYTLQQARSLLREGVDWKQTGLLERHVNGDVALPASWTEAGDDWSLPASALQVEQAGLEPDTPAHWHAQAGWVKPAGLVRALLSQPGIAWHGSANVAGLTHADGAWQLLDPAGAVLAQADMVVMAAGFATQSLLADAQETPPPLQAIRGQISYGVKVPGTPDLPPFPLNGHGHLTPQVPFGSGTAWFVGATYERDNSQATYRAQDNDANLKRLQILLPNTARQLDAEFTGGKVQAWAGVRCATPDRLPLLGPTQLPGLWICTAMGSRGLSMALLCGELLAAQLHGEPLPIEQNLARRLSARRFDTATHLQPKRAPALP